MMGKECDAWEMYNIRNLTYMLTFLYLFGSLLSHFDNGNTE